MNARQRRVRQRQNDRADRELERRIGLAIVKVDVNTSYLIEWAPPVPFLRHIDITQTLTR